MFYVLEGEIPPEDQKKRTWSTDFTPEDPFLHGDAEYCSECGGPIGSLEWLPPYVVDIEIWGTDFGDIVHFSNMKLFSERFVDAWRKSDLHGLTGFREVTVRRAIGRRGRVISPCPKYFIGRIARSRAAINLRASGLEVKGSICPECRLADGVIRTKRVVFEKGSWTGEDIFFARGLTGTVFVSKRFWEFCVDHQIRNASLIDCSAYKFDFYPWENQGDGSAH
jgi:hypothetical protein